MKKIAYILPVLVLSSLSACAHNMQHHHKAITKVEATQERLKSAQAGARSTMHGLPGAHPYNALESQSKDAAQGKNRAKHTNT